MKYKIIVDKQSRTNPSPEKKEYEIDIEELRCKGDVRDTLVITKGEDYVMRRLELTPYFVLKELEEPIKQVIPNVDIELFEGDNYIYLIDMAGNKFYAEYLIKNEFNDVYATKAEMSSAINQTAREVVISVDEKLTEYSKTEEMRINLNSLIPYSGKTATKYIEYRLQPTEYYAHKISEEKTKEVFERLITEFGPDEGYEKWDQEEVVPLDLLVQLYNEENNTNFSFEELYQKIFSSLTEKYQK